jgi:prolipoprotein diacylglyceryltransferase
VEFLKNDQSAFEASMQLNMGQWLSIPAIITGTTILLITKADKKAVQVSNSQ